MNRLMKAMLAMFFLCGLVAAPLRAQQAAGAGTKQKHALVKVAAVVSAPVTHPMSTLEKTFGTVVFAVESGVDVAHGGLSLADRAFDALSIQGKVPVLDEIYGFVSIANKDTGKLDLWLEKQETYLFGTHN